MRRLLVLFLVAAAACARLPGPMLSKHPAINLEVPRPVVVETSATPAPSWVRRPPSDQTGARSIFVGNGAAASLNDARDKARRDLLGALARFVSVDVESTFESKSSHRDGVESEEVHHEQSSRSDQTAESFREVTLSGEYWEKVAEPNGKSETYRCYLRADVPAEILARARLEKQISRARARGSKVVAVAAIEGDGAGSAEEVLRRLADLEGIFAAPLSAVSEPELIVRAKLMRGEAPGIEYELFDARAKAVRAKATVKSKDASLFALEELLVEALRRELKEGAK